MKTKIKIFAFLLLISVTFPPHLFSQELVNTSPVPKFSKTKSSLHSDFFVGHIWSQLEKPLYLTKTFRLFSFIKKRAENVNSEGGVDDSHFFTNRVNLKEISPEEVKKANLTTSGPDFSSPATIISIKASGLRPGLIIEDVKGDKYIIKLDNPIYPEMNSSAEIIGSKLFYLLGYNVPENYLVQFKRENLRLKEGLVAYSRDGFKKLYEAADVDQILMNAYQTSDGSFRAVASKFIEGKILGPMKFRDRRSNDPLDPIPHEHRRELRGLRVFCSWLNQFDLRRGNSLDVLVETDKGWYIKHYLVDFDGCLGSYGNAFKNPEVGHEYVMSIFEMFKSFITLGAYQRPWEFVDNIYPQTGYFTNNNFHPEKWTTHFPNYAFQEMDKYDAKWAADILGKVTDEQIMAAVESGMISNNQAKQDLIDKLIQRRDIIVDYWLSK